MKAIVKYAAEPGNMEIREVPRADPALVKSRSRWWPPVICGSDLHIYNSDIAIPVRPPVTVATSSPAVITELGEGVEGFEVGQRVVSETAFSYCGKCEACREGW